MLRYMGNNFYGGNRQTIITTLFCHIYFFLAKYYVAGDFVLLSSRIRKVSKHISNALSTV
jgi:hypothetical protein